MRYLATTFLLTLALLTTTISARDVPYNVRKFFNRVKSHRHMCRGSNKLGGGFAASETSPLKFSYCLAPKAHAIYLHGPRRKLADMDVDCDGDQHFRGDGRCASSADTQSTTAFQDEVQNFGISDLNANIHPYVVFGNEDHPPPTFDPREFGVEPLSVMAVVCGNKLIYGVWGDTNGDSNPSLIGEASLALATACFGNDVNGDNGHTETDVLYVAFAGQDAVPGAKGANWKAKNFQEFEDSITELGNRLIQRLS